MRVRVRELEGGMEGGIDNGRWTGQLPGARTEVRHALSRTGGKAPSPPTLLHVLDNASRMSVCVWVWVWVCMHTVHETSLKTLGTHGTHMHQRR
jgi:hypothetical protein